MKISRFFTLICMVILLITACSPAAAPQSTSTPPPPTATAPPPTPTNIPFHLAQQGPFMVGKQKFSVNDDSRGKYAVFITVWYPATPPAGSTSRKTFVDAEPDPGQAPYPLILSSTKVAEVFAPILVSHGFTWASVDYIDSYMFMDKNMINQPLDILFTLDQVATNPPENLKGMIDSGHVGTIGYSFDGYNSLAMSGARIDPDYYLAQCPTPDATTAPLVIDNQMSSFSCHSAENWEEFLASLTGTNVIIAKGLWQPMTDARIRAVMPMAPEGWWLFGEKGLASVDRPVLMIGSTEDTLYREDALIFDHLGTPDKSLITFLGKNHMMIYEAESVSRMAHFAVAFFSLHLKGLQDMAWYFSEGYVNQQPDLVWGVVPEK